MLCFSPNIFYKYFSIWIQSRYTHILSYVFTHFLELYYYDQLSRIQDKPIKLTIDCTNTNIRDKTEENDHMVSPIEHCLRTKWRDARIDWNGSEPIL